jgi:hypothetical protein
MADKYWVGGSGTWDNASTTNWSLTSGGPAGAPVPTSVDNVIFNTLSNGVAYAVTVGTSATALDITIANPATGVVTFTGTNNINCYGSWTNAAGVVFSVSGNLNFLSATTGRTITTNGVSLGLLNVVPITVGGGWTLVGAFTCNVLSIQGGSFSTGSYNVTCVIFQSPGTAVRALTLGTSTITLNNAAPWSFATTTNLTFSGASSTINCSNLNSTFAGGGLTYGTVNFTSTTGNSSTVISGANSFTNLNQTSPASQRKVVSISSNQTVTGTLTLGASNAPTARVQVLSQSIVTPITLTVATITTLSDVDFQNIIAAGASATLPWSGTRLGNGLGNTNITFDAGKTVYWNLVAGGNWSANAWATSSGGAPAAANFPLAQDTAIIENTGLTAGNTITLEIGWWIGTFNCTRTNAWTFAGAGGANFFKDFTITSATTVTYSAAISFSGIGVTQTVTTNGVALAGALSINNNTGSVVLNGNLTTASTQTTTLTTGTLDLAGFTLSTGIFSSSNSSTRAIAFGVGKIVVTGNNAVVVNIDTATNFSFTGTSNIESTYSGAVSPRVMSIGLAAGGTQSVAMNVKVTAGTDSVQLYGHWNNVDFTGFSGSLSNNGNKTYYGNLTISTGMSLDAGTNTLTFAATSGTKTITSNGKTFDFPVIFNGIGGTWQLQDALTLGATRNLTLTNGTLQSGGYLITSSTFTSTGAGVRNLSLNGGSISVTGTGTVWTGSGTNFSMGTTDVILLNSASAQTFSGGGLTYGVLSIGDANIKTITGSNTFNNIVNTVSPASVTFAASSTNTFSNFSLNGTSGNLVTLRSTVPGTQYTLVKV